MRKKPVPAVWRNVICFFLVLSLSACTTRQLMIHEMTGIIADGVAAFEEEDDLDLLEKAMPANIKLLEMLLESSPADQTLLVLLARLYGSYAFVFFEGKLEKAVLTDGASGGDSKDKDILILSETINRYYQKGMAFALRALEARHGPSREDLKKIATRDLFFERLTRDDVPALFWYGFNLGSYVNLNRHDVRAISQAGLVESAMQRTLELDSGYFFGGAHLFLLTYYASRPPMFGGNLEKAEYHYQQLRQAAGDDFLLADVYYARFYLTRIQDRNAYAETLMRVQQSTRSETYPLYNTVAAVKARIYLEAADRFFE